MNIVEKLRLVDCTFWYKPLGHGIDTDLDVPAYELGALLHEAANEIERLRKALKQITEVRYYGPEGPQKESHEMHEIANQALKGGE
jgi:hypothetical protein